MGFVYFSVPVISGYYLMEYVNSIAEANLKNLKEKSEEILPETRMQNEALIGMVKEWRAKNEPR